MPRVRLLVSTRKGLFVLDSNAGRDAWRVKEFLLQGEEVFHASMDPRDGRTLYAAVNRWKERAIWRSRNLGRTWKKAPIRCDKIWSIAFGHPSEPRTIYAGVMPAALFRSTDSGSTWREMKGLTRHPTRKEWVPGAGGLCLHTILPDPDDPGRIYVGISAAGAFVTTDGGRSWGPFNDGVPIAFPPQQLRKYKDRTIHRCVHKMALHTTVPGALYQQNHRGVYRTAGFEKRWRKINAGLPTTFGFAMAVHPRDGETIYVIPVQSEYSHWAPGGKLAVYRSRDGGKRWRRLGRGLPQKDAYLNVLRDGMALDALDPVGIYFGTNTGQVFGSRSGGESWTAIQEHLPPITAVTVTSP